ncbi:MAG: hypothetical protein E3J72_19195 [Planctomycetota bacterium]|nr:MAG: hypothetical protein E3J72_19195 [Planctomycetota bacterium]
MIDASGATWFKKLTVDPVVSDADTIVNAAMNDATPIYAKLPQALPGWNKYYNISSGWNKYYNPSANGSDLKADIQAAVSGGVPTFGFAIYV